MGKLLGNLAAGLGYALRWLAFLVALLLKEGPTIIGISLVVHGINQYDRRLGFIVAGIAILVAFRPRAKEKK